MLKLFQIKPSPLWWLVISAGCAIAAIVFGPRSALGLFIEPVTTTRGWGRDGFALAMAIQQRGSAYCGHRQCR